MTSYKIVLPSGPHDIEAVGREAEALLRLSYEIYSDLVNVQQLRRRKSPVLAPMEKLYIDTVIIQVAHRQLQKIVSLATRNPDDPSIKQLQSSSLERAADYYEPLLATAQLVANTIAQLRARSTMAATNLRRHVHKSASISLCSPSREGAAIGKGIDAVSELCADASGHLHAHHRSRSATLPVTICHASNNTPVELPGAEIAQLVPQLPSVLKIGQANSTMPAFPQNRTSRVTHKASKRQSLHMNAPAILISDAADKSSKPLKPRTFKAYRHPSTESVTTLSSFVSLPSISETQPTSRAVSPVSTLQSQSPETPDLTFSDSASSVSSISLDEEADNGSYAALEDLMYDLGLADDEPNTLPLPASTAAKRASFATQFREQLQSLDFASEFDKADPLAQSLLPLQIVTSFDNTLASSPLETAPGAAPATSSPVHASTTLAHAAAIHSPIRQWMSPVAPRPLFSNDHVKPVSPLVQLKSRYWLPKQKLTSLA